MQVVENMALISINATLLVQLASFLIFMVIFNRIMVRPLRRMMAERTVYVDTIVEEIKEADAALSEINHQIESQEDQVRNSAFQIQHRIEDEGQQEANDIVDQTRKEITEMRLKAQNENAAKITATRKQIESEAEPIADQMIAVLLGQRSAS
jgi:F-type H+-transporting ATPase subunit b